MTQNHLLGTNEKCTTTQPVVSKNQIIQMEGYDYDKFVVCEVIDTPRIGFLYKVINLRTRQFSRLHSIHPLSQKFGIGYYYDDSNPQFLSSSEVADLQVVAEQIEKEQLTEKEIWENQQEQLKVIGRERLQKLIPADIKAIIVAELHEDESDSMTDYFGYRVMRKVILGFSTHTKDLFSEMRSYAGNFDGTAYLVEKNEKYEHREKYTGGAGYYLGKNKYCGWIVKKVAHYKDRESFINAFALTAGDENNVCVKAKPAITAVADDFTIVDYSEKAIAVFGDTKPVKDLLKTSGGRFNRILTHENEKKAGWVFPKSKEQEVRNLLNIQQQ